MERTGLTSSPRAERIEHRIIANAREHLGDEEVLKMFRGQTALSPVILPLVGFFVPRVKTRTVILTDRSVITLQHSAWSVSTVTGLVSRHEAGAVPVELSRWSLRIAGEDPIFALPSTLADMQDIARMVRIPA